MFPNSGNPNSIQPQNVRLCVSATPKRNAQPGVPVRGSVGVALNGVQMRPGTADFYDGSNRRGFSRDRSSGWNLEGLGARELLGMDANNAHVDERGLYHYHGVPPALAGSATSRLLGYAADGFEIHVAGRAQRSSYSLKQGARPTAPGGRHDGTYNEDWQFVPGSGTLDVCNGGMLDGHFVYFATANYPFFPRCLWGTASKDFGGGDRGEQNRGTGRGADLQGEQSGDLSDDRRPGSGQGGHPRAGPPAEAQAACSGKAVGAACSFLPPGRSRAMRGTCGQTPDRRSACMPRARPH